MKLTAAAAQRFLQRPDPSVRALLLYGPNRGAIEDASAQVQGAVLGGAHDPYAVTRLTHEDLRKDKAALCDALHAQSLLTHRHLVRVRMETEAGAEALISALEEIEAGPPLNYLLAECFAATAQSASVKAFEKAAHAAALACYDDNPADLDAFVRRLLSERAVAAAPEAIARLRELVLADRTVLRLEAEKLALFAYGLGRPLTASDIDGLMGLSATAQLDHAAANALDGEGPAAVEVLERISQGTPITALKALERRLLRVLEARSMVERGTGPQDAVKALRPPVFWKDVDAMTAHVRRWRPARLSAALDRVWRCEIACKAAGAPQHLIVAYCYRDVASLA